MKPKTPLGKKLLRIRNRAIKSGMKLLSREEIEDELNETRRSHLDTANLMDFYRSCVFDLAAKLIRIENAVTDGERHGPGIHFRGKDSSCTKGTREIGGRSPKGRSLHKKKGG
jgi:hypothetical protein